MSALVQPKVGMTLGRYVIDSRVAAGGMGVVFRARLRGAHGFERTVAVKTVHPAFVADEEHRVRLLEEARIAAAICHDNIVQILDVCDEDGVLFLALEWIEGLSLRAIQRLVEKRGEPVPLPILVRILADVLDGLHHAHELVDDEGRPRGLVHRDVSPENIIVSEHGTAKLIDFGLAKMTGRFASITATGEVLGKVSYMPPEQARGAVVDRRADIWAVGAVLRFCATKTLPYDAASDIQRLYKLTLGQEPDPLPVGVPPWLESICKRALAVSPDERFPTCAAFCDALLSTAGDVASRAAVAAFIQDLRAAQAQPQALPSETAPTGREPQPPPPPPPAESVTITAHDLPVGGAVAAGPRRISRAKGVLLGVIGFVVVVVVGARSSWRHDAERPAGQAELATTSSAGSLALAAPASSDDGAKSELLPSSPAAPSALRANGPASASGPVSLPMRVRSTTPRAGSPPAASAAKVPPRVDCDPPYSVDERGIHHPKVECF